MAKRKLMKPGRTFTKKITRGPNKGDTVSFRVAKGGKPFPTAVRRDVGSPSTLRDNPGVKFGSGTKRKSTSRKTTKHRSSYRPKKR